ncbi:MAG: hypothetical protein MH137_01560 [Flavobacteriales bacterium]|nr:hypothetical protein [Flavobacteriales bacterium]
MFHNSSQTRYFVIDSTIQIEHLISKTLGIILGIDWKNSKSFGFKSSSLSFNQKVFIIQDLGKSDKLLVDKLDCLIQIRNKFAHVYEVKTFEDFFSLSTSTNDVKKKLERYYISDNLKNDENKYQSYFTKLTYDIVNSLIAIIINHEVERGKKNYKKDLNQKVVNELFKSEEGKLFIKKIIESQT